MTSYYIRHDSNSLFPWVVWRGNPDSYPYGCHCEKVFFTLRGARNFIKLKKQDESEGFLEVYE